MVHLSKKVHMRGCLEPVLSQCVISEHSVVISVLISGNLALFQALVQHDLIR